jgi:hypothetical protein
MAFSSSSNVPALTGHSTRGLGLRSTTGITTECVVPNTRQRGTSLHTQVGVYKLDTTSSIFRIIGSMNKRGLI